MNVVGTGRNKAANAAMAMYLQAQTEPSGSTQSNIQITVEAEESDIITDDCSERFRATVEMAKPPRKEVTVPGPWRDRKVEAIKDSEVLGKAFAVEGESGVKRVAQLLERKVWKRFELDGGDDSWLDGMLAGAVQTNGPAVPGKDRLIPPGEGWTRASETMLWDCRSQVYFVQVGDKAGQYLLKDKSGWTEVDPPHTGMEYPIQVRAAGASYVKRGAKMERSVMLPELPKIARLALKFPLSFVDAPANAFALFQGFRSPEAADYCSKNFHTKLIPKLASKIHLWGTKELQEVLKKVLLELDSEIMKSSYAYSGCCACVGLLLGNRFVVCGVGHVRCVLLYEDNSCRELLSCTGGLADNSAERERVEASGGILHGSLLHRKVEATEDAQRILFAQTPFEVLQIEVGGPSDEKQIRTAYRKLALRVHPDKTEDANKDLFNKAFARLDSAKEAVENLLSRDAEACRSLHKLLSAEIHTREGAAEFLGVDKSASTDTEIVTEEAERSKARLIKSVEKLQGIAKEYDQAVAVCHEAVETIRRSCQPEALRRQEALLRIGVPCSRALGARDLRYPANIVKMEPESAAWQVPTDKKCRVAMLCGATASLKDQKLVASSSSLKRQPKAAALRWCMDSDADVSSLGAVCIGFEGRKNLGKEDGPALKRMRSAAQAGTVLVRHILFRHQQLKTADPFARREGSAKGPGEAEANALAALEKLIATPTAFLKMCRDLSDCQSADQPGNLAGQMGWMARGEQEAVFEEAAFGLDVNEYSDVITTSRGVHVLQRLG
mmetsp:Transcript_46708/g.108891  ORF Transcript_46708/g.108891 Transcript_46708/m.108891 type:complete len:782 (+) Transcript_46708:70-2415(+)